MADSKPGRLPLAGLFHFPKPDMKTFVNKATGNRFPEHGCAHSFQVREKRSWKHGPAAIKTTLEIFERGTGWRKGKLKDWQQEEVADLAQGFTQAQWKEYAATYGVLCAREFLPCCDLMKPTCAWEILHPPQVRPMPAARAWFEFVFGQDPLTLAVPLIMALLNKFSFNILAFERLLSRRFGYPKDKDGVSIKSFITDKWGVEVCAYFENHFLKT